MTNKETIEHITPQLIGRGENPRELKFWLRIFRDLSPQLQEELARNLEEELRALSGNI